MYLGRIECEGKAAAILKEWENCLCLWKDGPVIRLKTEVNCENGCCLTYDPATQEARISYRNTTDLCRALFLLYAYDKQEPMTIRQNCAFRDFGIMLDCSRNAVLTPQALRKFLCYASMMGYQFVGLYTEDTLEVQGEPYFGAMRGRWTASEIKEADAYAHMFGMELRPYIQTLAHLNQALRHKDYRAVTDTGDILLMEEERTLQLLDHILASVSAMYQTRVVNLGMDEAELVGLGAYLRKHGYQERQGLMRKHLDQVLNLCENYGLQPQIWSDMFFKLAFDGEYYLKEEARDDLVKEKLRDIKIPDNLDLVYWDYYHLRKEEYDRMFRAHWMITKRPAFAGGVWRWQGFAPNNRFSMRIGYQALKSCFENNVQKVVLTSWGDNGSEADFFSVLPALFMDAEYAWNIEREEELLEEDEQRFCRMTGYTLKEFLLLDDANPYLYDGSGHNNACKYFLYNDPLQGLCDSLVKEGTAQIYGNTTKKLLQLSKKESPFRYLFETESALCKVLEKKADLGIRLRRTYSKKDKEALNEILADFPQMLEDLDSFYLLFKKQWHRHNRSFGFEIQTIRIGGLRQRLLDIQEILCEYQNGEREEIPELEETQLPFDLADGEAEMMEFNDWVKNVSASAMGW